RVLLLDEPFEGLAPAVIEELFEAFDRLREEVSILIVDHHLDLALALSDRTVALERGQATHIGPSRASFVDLDLRRTVLWLCGRTLPTPIAQTGAPRDRDGRLREGSPPRHPSQHFFAAQRPPRVAVPGRTMLSLIYFHI